MTTEEKFKERLRWFTDRIGQTIWRPATQCACDTCKDTYANGLEIHDRDHAYYLRDVEAEMGIDSEGYYRYFDTKEERDEHETNYSRGQGV